MEEIANAKTERKKDRDGRNNIKVETKKRAADKKKNKGEEIKGQIDGWREGG